MLIHYLFWYQSLLLAIGAYVVGNVLTQSGMILSGFEAWLNRLIGPDSAYPKGFHSKVFDPFAPSESAEMKPTPFVWLYKMIIGCYTCMAGQWAFWGFFIFFPYDLDWGWLYAFYHFCEHILFTLLTIYLVKFVAKLHNV